MPHLPPAVVFALVLAAPSTAKAQDGGPVFAFEALTVTTSDDPGLSKLSGGMADLFLNDVFDLLGKTDTYKDCEAKIVEWRRREDALKEIALQQDPVFDPATTVRPGHFVEPTIMVGGTLSQANGQVEMRITLRNHADGTPIETFTRSFPADDILSQTEPLSKAILDKACPPGFTASGGGGDHGAGIVVSGRAATVTDPFQLSGEFPGGSAEFTYTPTSETDGIVIYTLEGSGVTGAGTGKYTLTPQEDGTYRIDQTTTGCVDGIPNSCRTNSEVVILTPISR